ncbi:hypothetical protein ACHAXS_005363 [Conticribra weissflogii]
MTEEEKMQCLVLRAHQLSSKLNANSFSTLPVILDTGLSPFEADFVDYQPSNITLETAAHTNTVKGVGTIMWKFTTTSGKTVYLPEVGYHMPALTVRLFSPQSFLQAFGGRGKIGSGKVTLYFEDGDSIEFPLDRATNLPMYHGCSCNSAEKRVHGKQVCKELHGYNLVDFVGSSALDSSDLKHKYHNTCCSCGTEESNQNLSLAQKELLQWHWKLCINMRQI